MAARSSALLAVTTAASCFQTGIQWYTQVSTYPLFAAQPDDGFLAYHAAYKRRLPLAIYAPYSLLMACHLALVARPPAGLGRAPLAIAAGLNGAIMALSLALAAPVHARLDAGAVTREEGVRDLLRFNALRLAASTASSAILVGLLARRD